jgi:hypothetical protein
MKIRISKAIAGEFMTRDVFPTVDAGVIEADDTLAAQLLADAQFNSDADGPDYSDMPGIKRAYAALADQIIKARKANG